MTICGRGLSCEEICPVKKPGQECKLSMLEFAELLDPGLSVTPQLGKVLVPVGVV